MKKTLKILGLVGFTTILFLVVVLIAFYHLIRIGEFRRFLVSEIEQRTELKVQLGEADLEIGRVLGVSFRDLALSRPESSQPVIRAERITARVALLPLLQRQVVFNEIRLLGLATRMVRDREGNISVLDKLLEFSFLKEEEAQFSVDLRSIRLENGEIDFEDHLADGEVAKTRFHAIDLKLRRLRGTDLHELLTNEPVKTISMEPQGAALEFELKSAVEIDTKVTRLHTTGRIILPADSLEFRRAQWDAEVELKDLPGEMLRQFTGANLPVKSIGGSFSPRFRLNGNPARRIHLEGEAPFKHFELDAPDIFAGPVTPGDGRITWELHWSPEGVGFPRMDFRSKEISLSYKEATSAETDGDPNVELNITTPVLPIAVVRKYLPLKFLESPRLQSFVTAVRGGELQIKKAGIIGRRSEIGRLADSDVRERVWLDAELRELGVDLAGDDYLPLRGVQGRVVLENGVLAVKNVKGDYGRSHLTEVEGSYRGLFSDSGDLEFRAKGELNLAEVREQLKLKVFPAQAAKVSSLIKEISGQARASVTLRKAAASPWHIEGKFSLDSVRLRTEDLSLTELKGELSVSPKEVQTHKVRGLLFGSPIQLEAALKDYLSDNGSFDLAVESPGVKGGVVTRLLLESGTQQDPGTVHGSVRYRGSLASKGERQFTGTLDLAGVQISPQPLKQPLREVTGRVKLDEHGIDFQGLKGFIVGSPFDFAGRWRYAQKPQLLFTFGSPELDIGYLISQIDEESGDWYDTLQAQGKVGIAKGKYEGFEFADLKSDVVVDRRVWTLSQFTARSAGGAVQGVGTITDKPDILAFSLEPNVQGVPIKGFFSWFDMGPTEITGKVNLTGKLESVGRNGPERKKNLGGAFKLKIEDGTVRRLRILVQILNLLDLSRWFTLQMPDINKEGIRFRSVTGDFNVAKGVYSTENLFVDSDDLRMTGAGTIDVPNDKIEFVVAVRPFPGVDSAINFIPLIGRGIAAIKNSFLVASFNIKGSIDDPTITPAPLSTLSEVFFGVLGIPKKIIGLSGDGTKEEPKQPSKEQPKTPAEEQTQ
jgi:uncharacterized protein YhdP